jgi:hypothetical protein
MNCLLALIGIFTLVYFSPALAAEKLLTDHQLDTITAGTGGDGALQNLTCNTVAPQTDNACVQNGLDFGNPVAENVFNVPTVNVNDSVDAYQNVNSKNRYVVLKDYTHLYVKAVAFITAKGRNSL